MLYHMNTKSDGDLGYITNLIEIYFYQLGMQISLVLYQSMRQPCDIH